MSVRSRIADAPVTKAFGGAEPPAMQQAARDVSQMDMVHPFAPGEPIRPYDGYSRTPRQFDFVTGYNIATRPRTHERVSFETLKGLVGAYDVADICIWHRIDSIRGLDWKLVAADSFDGDISDAISAGVAALDKPDRAHHFETWLGKWLYGELAYGTSPLERMRNRSGRCVGLRAFDGTTVAPLLDYWGDSPGAQAPPGEPLPEAYVQYVNGLPWNWLTRADIIYEPYRLHNDSPYGRAPIESVMLNANTDIRFQLYFLQRFTEGNLPQAFASAPEGWSPDQVEQFQELWDSYMYGDQARKHQIRWIPGGSSFAWSDEKEFTDKFSLFLMRKTCASFHVVPADIGFTEDVNRSSGESQADVSHRVGDLPFIRYIQRILTSFLHDDLGLPLKFTFDVGEEQADRVQQAQADKIYVGMGAIGASDIREMRYGLAEPEGRPVPRYIFTERAGPIPLASLFAVAGQVDPATAAPLPGAPLSREVFGGTEGVLPNPPIKVMSLAEQMYGQAAMPPAPPPQPVMTPADTGPLALPAAPVAKEGEAAAGPPAGITSETGIYGYDGPGQDDDDVPARVVGEVRVAVDPERAAVAKELAAFRRYSRARRKAGTWRDFTFEASGRVQAHRLNDAGRLAVRKAAGEVAVAGLAVLAADTGRVLMLQRALCDDDPAAGTWEFPGGHIEQGESPLPAAWREYAEETRSVPPPGVQTGTWTAGDGTYQGIVWTVESEACVPVRSEPVVPNPDDPDGDQVESIAFWNPADLAGNPVIRPELLDSIDAVMAALGLGAAGDVPSAGDEATCPCGLPVVFDEVNGRQHGDGSVSHDDGESVSGKMAAVAKAGGAGPKEWPGWRLAGKVTAHWAPELTAAATGTLTRARLDQCARGYLAEFPRQQGDADGKRDRNHAAYAWLASQGITVGTGGIAAGVITDSYLVGAVSAAAMVNGTPADTGGWKPGDTSKAGDRIAALGAGAALTALLASAGSSTADRITGGILADLARALAGAEGDMDAADLGAVLSGVITDGGYSAGLVFTEICTYTGQAAQDYYMQHATGGFQWVLDPTVNNCPVCVTNSEADPRPLGQPWPSGDTTVGIHIKCGCAFVPGWA